MHNNSKEASWEINYLYEIEILNCLLKTLKCSQPYND